MDAEVVKTLEEAGMDLTFTDELLHIGMCTDADDRPISFDDDVPVLAISGHDVCAVTLRPAGQLFVGDACPPDLARGPTDEYFWFFYMIEVTASDYCEVADRPEPDQEFKRLYRLLGRRPDARDWNPLFSHLRAAARLYMSIRDVSRREFEAVMARLEKSARRWGEGYGSTNYVECIRRIA
jgi:hypothetical protein